MRSSSLGVWCRMSIVADPLEVAIEADWPIRSLPGSI
jgi:hypothetical protein